MLAPEILRRHLSNRIVQPDTALVTGGRHQGRVGTAQREMPSAGELAVA
jgi:hypothetical protein